jgi:hypothetical protein
MAFMLLISDSIYQKIGNFLAFGESFSLKAISFGLALCAVCWCFSLVVEMW